MAMDFTITACLKTVVALTYLSEDVVHGKWRREPLKNVSIGEHELFKATNRAGSLVRPEAKAIYQVADGTKFTIYVQGSATKDNYCSIEMGDLSGPWRVGLSYPRDGDTFTAKFFIETSTGFVDVGVFPEQIVSAPRCDRLSDAEIRGFIGGLKCVYLRDVFAVKGLDIGSKIWAVSSEVFLTPESKAILLRDLAALCLNEISNEDRIYASVIERAIAYNESIVKGSVSSADDLMKEISQLYENKRTKRSRALIDIAAALLDTEFSIGWANAVSSYLGNKENENVFLNRQHQIVSLVEKRL